jgi:4-hydroxybutyryl-CoA dehydratase/vinylacetyl-CoA-Delta-isomerase
MKTGQDYIESLRKRNIKVYVKGQLLESSKVVDHPFIRGHVASAALT